MPLPAPGPGEVLVRTRYSGVSRGTETLVFPGGCPPDQYATMRAPFQEGDFPAPVKYGYLSVGVVEAGPAELRGRTVFCLLPAPERVRGAGRRRSCRCRTACRPRRAVLAGTVETAVNALWDAAPLVGDRVSVVGGRAWSAAAWRRCWPGSPASGRAGRRRPGPGGGRRRRSASTFAAPADAATGGRDLVVHASATAAGLQRSLDLLAPEGTVVELSWYGDRPVQLPLGGAFHSGRLTIRSSQVGTVAPARAGRSYADRLALALDLLADPAFDALITGAVPRSPSCPTCSPGSAPASCPRSATSSPTTRSEPCSA